MKSEGLKKVNFNKSFEVDKTEHEYEYQEVCSDIQKMFEDAGNEKEKKLVWTLPHQKGMTEYKIKQAGEKMKERGIITFGYLRGIIKNL